MSKLRRRGFSLIEVLIAAIILAMCGVAVLTIFSGSTNAIKRTDARREYRFYLREILAHVNRQSLHKLFFHYPSQEARQASGGELNSTLLGALAVYDQNGVMQNPQDEMSNPLGFTQAFITQFHNEKLSADIQFDFIPRNALGIGDDGKASKEVGILHMQAGDVEVILKQDFVLSDGSTETEEVARIRQPILCPAIVGRPGLKLSSCPAINQKVMCAYLPILARAEGFGMPQDIQNTCDNQYPDVDARTVTLDENT